MLFFLCCRHGEFVHTAQYPEKKEQEAMISYLATARGEGHTLNVNCAFTELLTCRLLIAFTLDTALPRIILLDEQFPTGINCSRIGHFRKCPCSCSALIELEYYIR